MRIAGTRAIEVSQMTDNGYFACQVGIICGLLFLVAVAAVSQHPQWFG
jgi:hypothetical protein